MDCPDLPVTPMDVAAPCWYALMLEQIPSSLPTPSGILWSRLWEVQAPGPAHWHAAQALLRLFTESHRPPATPAVRSPCSTLGGAERGERGVRGVVGRGATPAWGRGELGAVRGCMALCVRAVARRRRARCGSAGVASDLSRAPASAAAAQRAEVRSEPGGASRGRIP